MIYLLMCLAMLDSCTYRVRESATIMLRPNVALVAHHLEGAVGSAERMRRCEVLLADRRWEAEVERKVALRVYADRVTSVMHLPWMHWLFDSFDNYYQLTMVPWRKAHDNDCAQLRDMTRLWLADQIANERPYSEVLQWFWDAEVTWRWCNEPQWFIRLQLWP